MPDGGEYFAALNALLCDVRNWTVLRNDGFPARKPS